MRGWVSAVANYSEPVALGAVMRALAVGRVEESRDSDFHPGEYVTGMFGWQDYAVMDAKAIQRKVGGAGLPISTSLGVLGLNGLTAYFALLDEGVDVSFDNTAGPISDSIMQRLKVGARVVICGTASIASWDPPPEGPRVERHLLAKRVRMQGFLIFDHVQRYPGALRELESWARNRQVRYQEDILDGIEQAPGSIAELHRGKNLGKRLIRIAPESPA